jgi:hypothetical protein
MKNNNITPYGLLILIALSWSSCSSHQDVENESDIICAPNEYYYLLTTEKEQCFAEKIPLIGCFPIDKEGTNNFLAEYCKESDEGMYYINFDSMVQLSEPGWTQCPTEYTSLNTKLAQSIDELKKGDCLLQPEDKYACAQDEFAYLLTEDGTNCKAEHFTLDSCVFISATNANNASSQFCKETTEGTIIIIMGQWHSNFDPEWDYCDFVEISNDPSCNNCCILEEK